MGKLLRYADSNTQCWSRVNLPNGDSIWISVAQSGVLVKRSRLGLLGAKLYHEKNVYRAAMTASALDDEFVAWTTPDEMNNPVLRAFTQAALEAETASQLSIRLNEAYKE
jgi:hypothetical protein